MPMTAVGLFENVSAADQVVHDLEVGGFPRERNPRCERTAGYEGYGSHKYPAH